MNRRIVDPNITTPEKASRYMMPEDIFSCRHIYQKIAKQILDDTGKNMRDS